MFMLGLFFVFSCENTNTEFVLEMCVIFRSLVTCDVSCSLVDGCQRFGEYSATIFRLENVSDLFRYIVKPNEFFKP
jgi:hypothetical protein